MPPGARGYHAERLYVDIPRLSLGMFPLRPPLNVIHPCSQRESTDSTSFPHVLGGNDRLGMRG